MVIVTVPVWVVQKSLASLMVRKKWSQARFKGSMLGGHVEGSALAATVYVAPFHVTLGLVSDMVPEEGLAAWTPLSTDVEDRTRTNRTAMLIAFRYKSS